MKIFNRKGLLVDTPAAAWSYEYRDLVPSKEDGFRFFAVVRFSWSLDRSETVCENSRDIAASCVRSLIEPYAAQASVLRAAATEQDINVAATSYFPLCARGVCVHHVRVSLTADEATLTAAQRLEHERQELAVQHLQQDRLRAKMGFLRNEALRDPASARLFWLLERRGEASGIPSAAELDDLVQKTTIWSPENRWVAIAQTILRFTEGLSEARRNRLVDHLAKIFVEYGEPGMASELSTTQDVSSEKEPDPEKR
jgi:hypothetical protein